MCGRRCVTQPFVDLISMLGSFIVSGIWSSARRSLLRIPCIRLQTEYYSVIVDHSQGGWYTWKLFGLGHAHCAQHKDPTRSSATCARPLSSLSLLSAKTMGAKDVPCNKTAAHKHEMAAFVQLRYTQPTRNELFALFGQYLWLYKFDKVILLTVIVRALNCACAAAEVLCFDCVSFRALFVRRCIACAASGASKGSGHAMQKAFGPTDFESYTMFLGNKHCRHFVSWW